MLALKIAEGPIVATFHTSTTKSLALSTFQGVLRRTREDQRPHRRVRTGPALAGGGARLGRGGDPQRRPRRRVRAAPPLAGYPRDGKTVLFLGRYDEPRKGMAVLMGALPSLVEHHPDLEILVVGRGDEDRLRRRRGGCKATCGSSARSATRRRRRRCAAPTCTAPPTPAGRASASSSSRRWPPAPPWSPATSTRSAGCCETAAGLLVPVGDSTRFAAAIDSSSTTTVRRSGTDRRRRPGWSASTTGRWSPTRSCACTTR